MDCSLKMIRKPAVDEQRDLKVWESHVYPLKDAYEMS
jgi:hypothetical protein